MASTRPLDLITLDNAASYYAEEFKRGSSPHPHAPGVWIAGPARVMQDFYNFTYKDEFEFVLKRFRDMLDPGYRAKFEGEAAARFSVRSDDVFEQELAERLAINPAGEHIPGVIGTVQLGNRKVGRRVKEIKTHAEKTFWEKMLFKKTGKLIELRTHVKNDYWPVYAGEQEERVAESAVADDLPSGADAWSPAVNELLATNPRLSNLAAIAACDAIVDRLDLGATAATIRGRSGAQPAGPDATETGTLLFTLTMSATAFGAAADAAPGGIATAASITADSSADATDTLGYCRCGSTGAGADDEIDGEAATSGGDFNFNTLAIVSGANVSMSSFTVTVPES